MAEASEKSARREAIEQRLRARRELELFVRRLGILLTALFVLIMAGTAGFVLTEGVSVGYAFAWTIDTITTAGTIPDARDTGGRALKVALELIGIGTLFYGLATVAEFFVSGQLSGLLEERRTQKMIDSYSEHYIICGFGRVGRQVARDLRAAGADFVVIDPNPENREAARDLGVPLIDREPADDEVLLSAGVVHARAVIACVDSDAENIFIALTARELRSDVLIIARASAEDSEKKLLRAGADRVISPYKSSGSQMARFALHPQVGGAVPVADGRVEEIDVPGACAGVGKTIEEISGQAVIVALRHAGGEVNAQPIPQTVVKAGDMLVALGSPAALEQLEEMFQPVRAASGVADGSR
ncbi:MAG: TrkA family potassium uptake protein [Solirubrobacterales bacterium]|nr:TrkA family potassium uptake protein [Solirubrobacterales bacterium]MBV9717196.1 TrkA family potassium uptake protein [Solirubrobacterales bacterium]